MISVRLLKTAFRRSRSRLVTCGVILSLSLVPVSTSLAAEPEGSGAVDLSGYEGHWQRIEASESDAARESAIEKAVKGLSWIVRRMAGGVLRRSTTPPPELQFAWDGEHLYQRVEGENGEYIRPVELDGELRTLKDRHGVDFASAWAWTGKGLRLRWEQHQATGNNIYRLDQDSETLIVEHTINVTAISNVAPIVFLSRFSRTDVRGPADAEPGPIVDHPNSD